MPDYGVIKSGSRTETLLRKLRERVGDEQRELYEQDNDLVQKLVDNFADTLKASEGVAAFVTPEDPEDPLAVDAELTTDEESLWVLFTARALLKVEMLRAARMAASIRTAAGQMNYQELYKALKASLDEVEADIARVLDEGVAGVAFVDHSASSLRYEDPDEAAA